MKPTISLVAARCCAAALICLFTFTATAVAQSTSTTPGPSPERAIIERLGRPEIPPHPGSRPQLMSTEDVVVGEGATLAAGDTAVLQYIAADWETGEVLGRVHGGQAAVRIRIDRDQVIPGWWQGMPGMSVGGRRAITLTPELAIGGAGAPPAVLNNKTYYYIVDLLRVEPAQPSFRVPPAPESAGVLISNLWTPFG